MFGLFDIYTDCILLYLFHTWFYWYLYPTVYHAPGTLYDIVYKRGLRFKEPAIKFYAAQLLVALDALHSVSICIIGFTVVHFFMMYCITCDYLLPNWYSNDSLKGFSY